MAPSDDLADRVRQAFLDFGYEQLTMSGIARVCGLTRRGLYHHFSNKEEAFRHFLRVANEQSVRRGMAAGRAALEAGSGAGDILGETMDSRYGDTRRLLATSPHALEINDQAFRRAGDLMIESAVDFHRQLADFLAELAHRGKLALKPGIDVENLAQMLADGARGVNQSRPPVPPDGLAGRYRRMCEAILYGCAEPPAG